MKSYGAPTEAENKKALLIKKVSNPFHATVLFLYPLKTENLFREYKKKPVRQNKIL